MTPELLAKLGAVTVRIEWTARCLRSRLLRVAPTLPIFDDKFSGCVSGSPWLKDPSRRGAARR